MKKILMAAAGAALLAGNAFAANLVITTYFGESLATYSKTDDNNDDNDDISFFDHYLDSNPGYSPFHNVSLTGESAYGGGELQLRWEQKKVNMTQLNGWVNFQSPFGAPGVLTLKFGRFDARPAVDFVGDANRGYHYQSYAVNPFTGNAGFDPHVMNWFLANQGFERSAHSRVKSRFAARTYDASGNLTGEDFTWQTLKGAKNLTGYNWFFNDLNNAAGSLSYSDTWRYFDPTFMVQYALNDDLVIRWAATSGGSADAFGGSLSHDFYGQKTFTNWNAQVGYKVGDIAKLGLTVKMSDSFSGVYTEGSGLWHSAGTDLTASLAASSDTLVDGLKLFVGYGFAGVYMGMKGDVGTKEDLSETYLFHAIDLRAVYELDEQLSLGLNTNISMVNQSEWEKEYNKDAKDFVGFSVGLSASYALSDILAIDFNAGFRCLDLNNERGTAYTRSGSNQTDGKTTEGDMMTVSSIGLEPSLVFTLNQNAALSIGVNVLIQNLSGDDVYITAPNTNHMSVSGTQYPFTTTVTLPLFLFIRI